MASLATSIAHRPSPAASLRPTQVGREEGQDEDRRPGERDSARLTLHLGLADGCLPGSEKRNLTRRRGGAEKQRTPKKNPPWCDHLQCVDDGPGPGQSPPGADNPASTPPETTQRTVSTLGWWPATRGSGFHCLAFFLPLVFLIQRTPATKTNARAFRDRRHQSGVTQSRARGTRSDNTCSESNKNRYQAHER